MTVPYLFFAPVFASLLLVLLLGAVPSLAYFEPVTMQQLSWEFLSGDNQKALDLSHLQQQGEGNSGSIPSFTRFVTLQVCDAASLNLNLTTSTYQSCSATMGATTSSDKLTLQLSDFTSAMKSDLKSFSSGYCSVCESCPASPLLSQNNTSANSSVAVSFNPSAYCSACETLCDATTHSDIFSPKSDSVATWADVAPYLDDSCTKTLFTTPAVYLGTYFKSKKELSLGVFKDSKCSVFSQYTLSQVLGGKTVPSNLFAPLNLASSSPHYQQCGSPLAAALFPSPDSEETSEGSLPTSSICSALVDKAAHCDPTSILASNELLCTFVTSILSGRVSSSSIVLKNGNVKISEIVKGAMVGQVVALGLLTPLVCGLALYIYIKKTEKNSREEELQKSFEMIAHTSTLA